MNKQIAALATDEQNIVMWDIDALLRDFRERPYVTVDTRDLTPREWLTIDEQHAQKVDVSSPIILFELPGEKLYIADGNHRLYKAAAENVPSMNVIVVPEDEHLCYLLPEYRGELPQRS